MTSPGDDPDSSPVSASCSAWSTTSPRRSRRRASCSRPRLAIVIAIFIALAAAVIWVISAALTGPTATELEPVPSVPGQLGVHLEELEQAVNG